jgi:hypothetical protein
VAHASAFSEQNLSRRTEENYGNHCQDSRDSNCCIQNTYQTTSLRQSAHSNSVWGTSTCMFYRWCQNLYTKSMRSFKEKLCSPITFVFQFPKQVYMSAFFFQVKVYGIL